MPMKKAISFSSIVHCMCAEFLVSYILDCCLHACLHIVCFQKEFSSFLQFLVKFPLQSTISLKYFFLFPSNSLCLLIYLGFSFGTPPPLDFFEDTPLFFILFYFYFYFFYFIFLVFSLHPLLTYHYTTYIHTITTSGIVYTPYLTQVTYK